MAEKSITASILWDKFGIGVSGICAIHCLFFPAIISLLPVFTSISFLHEWAHPLFLILLLPIVYYAAKRSHFDRFITSLLIVGFLFVLAGWLLGHFWLGLVVETSLTVIGSFILISGHWLNYKHHRSCKVKSHNHHPIEMQKK
ncbi:MAG: MerC domain-containing protein [Balneolaceae bacterium]|nr:MerC domain-containing protein [Balneolaceae bacterium]